MEAITSDNENTTKAIATMYSITVINSSHQSVFFLIIIVNLIMC